MKVALLCLQHFRCGNKMFNSVMMKKRTTSSKNYFSNFLQKSLLEKEEKKIANDRVKPPNVVVYGAESQSHIAKCVRSIENCVGRSSYAVYPISSAKFFSEPWPENAKVLVVLNSSFKQGDILSLQNIVQKYLSIGGKVLSFSPHINNLKVQHNQGRKFSGKLTLTLPNVKNRKSLDIIVNGWQNYDIDCEVDEKCLVRLHNCSTNDCVAFFVNGDNNSIMSMNVRQEEVMVPSFVIPIIVCRFPQFVIDFKLPLLPCNESDDSDDLVLLSYLLHCLGIESIWQDKSDVCLEIDDRNRYQAFLYSCDIAMHLEFLQRISGNVTNDEPFTVAGLKFVSAQTKNMAFSDNEVAVIHSTEMETLSSYDHHFHWEVYKSNLSSNKWGRLVIYGDVLPTTMDVFDGILPKLPINMGPVAIARQQTKGQGRGSNKWLSPVGCAMFTLVLHIPVHSRLGVALPFLQHLTSAAVVHSIRGFPGFQLSWPGDSKKTFGLRVKLPPVYYYNRWRLHTVLFKRQQDVDLRLKWPNDIYFGSSVKLGGVIVKSTIFHDVCIASIGCGVNISNSKPTVCVNDILKDQYFINRQLTCEEVIARTLSCLEQMVSDFQILGSESFTRLYYKYWLHSNSDVKVELNGASVSCSIVGIDQFGFLRARRHDNGEVMSLHPDGNSFDIMRNLIAAKKSV